MVLYPVSLLGVFRLGTGLNKGMAAPGLSYVEQLKLDFIENALVLAQTFGRRAVLYTKDGEPQKAISARAEADNFYKEALEMFHLLEQDTPKRRSLENTLHQSRLELDSLQV